MFLHFWGLNINPRQLRTAILAGICPYFQVKCHYLGHKLLTTIPWIIRVAQIYHVVGQKLKKTICYYIPAAQIDHVRLRPIRIKVHENALWFQLSLA